jgi:hypothetical protein
VTAIMAAVPEMAEPNARAAAHAVFGLINSTPHSRYLDRAEMAELLRGMALAALTGQPAVDDDLTRSAS